MRRWSGWNWVLLLGGAVLLVLATLRIPTGANRQLSREETFPPQRSVFSEPPEEPPNTPEQTALLERIFAAWRKRQDAAKTFHFTWQARVTQPEGDANVTLPQWGWWEGGDGRFREDSVAVEPDDNGRWRQIAGVRLIHDGSLNSSLGIPQSAAGAGNGGSPWITLWRGDIRNRVRGMSPFKLLVVGGWWSEFMPVLLAVRPMHADFIWSTDQWQVAHEDVVTNGVHCVEIHRRNRYAQYDKYWVDPKRDNVVVRWKAQNLFRAATIDYQRDPKHGWVPSQWSWSEVTPNQPPAAAGKAVGGQYAGMARPMLAGATVRSYSIGEPLPADTFARTNPPHTLVYDVTAGSEADWKLEQSPANQSKEAQATLEAIAAAWAKRRAAIQSFEVAWQRKRMMLDNNWLQGPVTANFTACIQGDRFEYEFTGAGPIPRYPGSRQPLWNPAYGKTAFDGVETRELEGRRGSGSMRTGPGFNVSDGSDCVWLAVCPWDARLTALDPAKFQVVAQDAKAGDAHCVLVRCDRSGNWSTFLWLDPSRDFLVLRKHEVTDGMDTSRVDFSYRQDASHRFVPTGWHETRAGWIWEAGLSLENTVKEATFNRPIPASRFAIEFAKGAYVNDLDPEIVRDEKAGRQVSAVIAQRWAKPDASSKAKPELDPKFDARVDLEKALKIARETKRRVLIEFGGQASPDCAKLYEALTQDAEITALLRKSFVLLLVDADYRDAGQIVLNQYVPDIKQGPLPLLTVMTPDETVLDASNTASLKSGDQYGAERLKAYLEKWASHK